MKMIKAFSNQKDKWSNKSQHTSEPRDSKLQKINRATLSDNQNTTTAISNASKLHQMTATLSGGINGAKLEKGRSLFSKKDEEELAALVQGNDLLQIMRKNIIGRNDLIYGPFGPHPTLHVHNGTGQTLEFIETYISNSVRPGLSYYSSNSSIFGAQARRYVKQAKEMIMECINASLLTHELLFCQPGTDGVLLALIDLLNIRAPQLIKNYNINFALSDSEIPVILVGPGDLDSNLSIWELTVAEIVLIPQDMIKGGVSLDKTEDIAHTYSHRSLKVACLAAYERITGIAINIEEVTEILHKHGFLVFWDYTNVTSAAIMDVASYEGILLCPQRYPGGNDTLSAIVITNKVLEGLATNDFKRDFEMIHKRYMTESRSVVNPNGAFLVPALRTGLAYYVRQLVGPTRMGDYERGHVSAFCQRVSGDPNIELIGQDKTEYLEKNKGGIVSFNICVDFSTRPQLRYLHSYYVVALLADLYGIVAHAESYTGGRYKDHVFGKKMTVEQEEQWKEHVEKNNIWGFMPGWVSINLDCLKTAEEVDFITRSILQIASYGWKLLPLYRMDPTTGYFEHHKQEEILHHRDLGDIKFVSKRGNFWLYCLQRLRDDESRIRSLDEAMRIYAGAQKYLHLVNYKGGSLDFIYADTVIPAKAKQFQWFAMPSDALFTLIHTMRQGSVDLEALAGFGDKMLGRNYSLMVNVTKTSGD